MSSVKALRREIAIIERSINSRPTINRGAEIEQLLRECEQLSHEEKAAQRLFIFPL